jgi:acetyl/propionyl-CoA carboxylase alpha subunit
VLVVHTCDCRGFLPSIGPLITYKEPLTVDGASDIGTVRIDTGVFEGATISMYYDPMISKLCTHAPTRDQAIRVMEGALDQYVVQGLGNNITFLRDVYRNPRCVLRRCAVLAVLSPRTVSQLCSTTTCLFMLSEKH